MLEDIEKCLRPIPRVGYVIQWISNNRIFISLTESCQALTRQTISHHCRRLERLGYSVRLHDGAIVVCR